ncbi:39S ribosomal protein L19, mitochondrial-like [Bufo gargarizans]|uniref:39S ribosomal protein L19, mitochondrial-like n=1 Tax=Bufo gargarizans TaxID=30331 RepID=UPI001CF0F44A|nr:39S ribosomal protein L19, mitochondrial-like [Bufo gargarizans]XP_044146554.1 39S ribosomal protein L19, mitochondrial-like [Bufo gargarizans]
MLSVRQSHGTNMALCGRSLLLVRYRAGILTPARLLSDGEPTAFKPPVKPLIIDKRASQESQKRFLSPEFIPPRSRKNPLTYYVERQEMIERRKVLNIPEFYVGSILAVTVAERHANGKSSRFVGICIHRSGRGLGATFLLRNIIDGQGVEIRYELYNPLIQDIQVLKLEKRVDDKLFYLRDALPEYSTFDVNMKPIISHNSEVPLNQMQVKMRPRPWSKRWEQEKHNIKGINFDYYLLEKHKERAKKSARPWDKFDMLKEYDTSKIEKAILEEISQKLSQPDGRTS